MLFPDELQAGVAILRYPESPGTPGAASTQDGYVFQILQTQHYSFTLIGDDLPAGTQVTMTNASGQPVPLGFPTGDQLYIALPVAGDVHGHRGGMGRRRAGRASPTSC